MAHIAPSLHVFSISMVCHNRQSISIASSLHLHVCFQGTISSEGLLSLNPTGDDLLFAIQIDFSGGVSVSISNVTAVGCLEREYTTIRLPAM